MRRTAHDPVSADERKRALKTAAMRRLRKRERRGEIVVNVVLDNDTIATLIGLGWIAESESESRKQVGCGISKLLRSLVA